MGGKDNNTPFSFIDSSSHPAFSISSSSSSSSSSCSPQPRGDLSTDLRLGLSLSSLTQDSYSKERQQVSNWPPVKPHLRSTLTRKGNQRLFVKVYMEGIPIGRKLDLYAHKNYNDLTRSLGRMFGTSITCSNIVQLPSNHVLTYEDKEGDWMMVGDVPWELFLASVKRLKITRAGKC